VLSEEPNWKEYQRQLRRPSGDRACLCGSQKRFRVCHPIAWHGLVRLGDEIDRLGMKRRGAFDQARTRRREQR
jgi:hypothetical protein